MIPINEGHSRIALREYGAQLRGDTEPEFFDAAQAHSLIIIHGVSGRWSVMWGQR